MHHKQAALKGKLMTTKNPKLDNLPDVDNNALEADHAAYLKNEKATEQNLVKLNKPKTRFDNPDRIGKTEEPRNEGDTGGNSD
jgi:hypothetical protein